MTSFAIMYVFKARTKQEAQNLQSIFEKIYQALIMKYSVACVEFWFRGKRVICKIELFCMLCKKSLFY